MSKWEVFNFEEIIFDDTKNGNKIKKEDYLEHGLYPVIDQGQNEIAGYRNNDNGLYNNVPAIIFGDHTRVIKYINTPFFLGADGVKLLKSKKDNVDYKYLYYFFVKNEIPNTGYNRHFKWLKELVLPIPPLEIQKQIAKTLDTATELLAMRKQQLAELDNLIESTFYDMFGDPVTNPMGWEIFQLSDCLSVIGGYAFKSTDFSDEGIPVIKIGNINSGVFHNNGIAFWKYDKRLDKYLLHPNDIVISLTGTVGKEDYANVCILPDKYPDYYLNQRNAKLELNENINVYYLLYILKDTKIKGQLTGISRGIRQANILNADILALNIPLPKVELQIQFASIVTKIEEQKSLVKKAMDETQYLFDSLMCEYFE